jgi:triacylglycerol lipase
VLVRSEDLGRIPPNLQPCTELSERSTKPKPARINFHLRCTVKYARCVHRLYFVPGMFGFGRLGSYDYFGHLAKALKAEFASRGELLETITVDTQPTASIRRRAARFAETIARTCDREGPIHVLGHSTGGLDARLVASPSAQLPIAPDALVWLPRLHSVTTLNTPHYGTPLASFFATVSGQRMLYALSALTVVVLTLGAPPLNALSALVVALGKGDGEGALDRLSEGLLRILEPAMTGEAKAFLQAVKEDQGAVIQLTPEAMDLFQAGVEDRAGVTYQSVASMSPPQTARGFLKLALRPWTLASSVLFSTLQRITSRADEKYPCAAPFAGAENEAMMVKAFGRAPGVRASDGIVPTRSQIWDQLVWCGYGDHLDVLGHFDDPARGHLDWMCSGSKFTHARFTEMVRAIANGMLRTR